MGNRRLLSLATVLVSLAVIRVVLTYKNTAQGFDEPCHVAAAIELLDKHTYTLDPVHPPLSRLAIGIPLYLAGERFPRLSPEEAVNPNYNVVGNHILYDDAHYLRNLILARAAMLPFLIAVSLFIYFWCEREFGESSAIVGLALLTTTPIVLAFSSLAYTDMVAATTQCAALFAFAYWLQSPGRRSTWLLGLATGLAISAKFTSFFFLPCAAAAIVACRWWLTRESFSTLVKVRGKSLVTALALAIVVLWASYGFSIGHIREGTQISAEHMPSFQHFPAPISKIARSLVVWNPMVPTPALWRGLAEAWVLNKTSPPAYLLQSIRRGGWWYFFLVGLVFKTPLPLLILFFAGLLCLKRYVREKSWSGLVPAVSVFAILVATMSVKYNAGMRHVLAIFPFMAVVAGQGAAYLWRLGGKARTVARCAVVLLLCWQGVETLRAQSDFVSYFNELAGHDPSRIMVAGCDLDCGQDLFRLATELRSRNVSHVAIAIWSSAEITQSGLPAFTVLQPFKPTTGWIAVSARSRRFGDVLHATYPIGALDWLRNFQPVAHVGHTIALYHIPGPPTLPLQTAERVPSSALKNR